MQIHPIPHHSCVVGHNPMPGPMASIRVARTSWRTRRPTWRSRTVQATAKRRGRDVEAALEAYTAEKRDVVAVVTLRRPTDEEEEEEEVALVFRGMTSSLTHFTSADLESSVLGDAHVVDVSLAEAPYQPNETKYVRRNVQVEELLQEIGMDPNELE